jgi:hypothetical protein
MYNWRLRKGANETTASFISRVISAVNAPQAYCNRNNRHTSYLYTTSLTALVYIHSELGDDTYTGADKGSAEHPYATFGGVSADGITSALMICCGRFASAPNIGLVVADTYGCAFFDSQAASCNAYGCYFNVMANATDIGAINCVLNLNGHTFSATGVRNSILINMQGLSQTQYTAILMADCVLLNCYIQSSSFTNIFDCIAVNSSLTFNSTGGRAASRIYQYNSTVSKNENNPLAVVDISGDYQSLADCFIDPNHLNFAVKRSEVRAGTPFEDWQGFTGDAIDFAKVVGENIQEDTGSYTIDQQTPGEGYLLSHILDNRGTFNNVFTGFINQVFHYNTNNIAITPFERYDTEHIVTVEAGTDVSVSISADTLFTVTRDCEIDGEVVSRYSNVILEAGSHDVTSAAGVQFYPYNYNNIGNYVQVRFANLGKCSTVAAGGTLRTGCSYLNQSGSDITISNGDTVAAGKTYVCDTANLTADGALLLVFDDARDNFVTLSTHSFQTEYMAGYVVKNSKFPTDVNLLDRDGKTIPLTEAFGEYNDIDYIPSKNWQYDYMQVRICYKVYPF